MIEIRSRDGSVIYASEKWTLKDALTEAAAKRADLRGAYLGGAYLGGAYLGGAYLGGAYLGGAYLGGADLGGAYLGGADLPSPTMLLLAHWGELTVELTADLMLFDASCHPDPARFDEWAGGGACPYDGVKVQRAASFRERRELWGKGQLCRPYDLMVRVLAEKCPVWSDEKRAAFESRFGK